MLMPLVAEEDWVLAIAKDDELGDLKLYENADISHFQMA